VGAAWLAKILYIDAFISPGGTSCPSRFCRSPPSGANAQALTTFTLVPHRGRVLLAKALACGLVALAATAVASTVGALVSRY
jgi:hypothetical protein